MGLIHNMAVRIIHRIEEIPQRGLPSFRTPSSEFDREYHVKTAGIVWLTNPFSENFTHGIRYDPCSPDACRWAIESSNVDTKTFTFIDVGCGKGRALLIASQYEFPHVIGVEYSRRLCRQARANLVRFGVPVGRCEVVCADAADYAFPPGHLFVFLNNPFDAKIIHMVLEHLKDRSEHLLISFVGQGRRELRKLPWLSHVACGPDIDLFSTFSPGVGAGSGIIEHPSVTR